MKFKKIIKKYRKNENLLIQQINYYVKLLQEQIWLNNYKTLENNHLSSQI